MSVDGRPDWSPQRALCHASGAPIIVVFCDWRVVTQLIVIRLSISRNAFFVVRELPGGGVGGAWFAGRSALARGVWTIQVTSVVFLFDACLLLVIRVILQL